jgi:hypothetical protein
MSTSSTQFDEYYKDEKLYGGCYSKDELASLKPDGKFWVVNMEDSNKGSGTHWVVVIDFLPIHILYTDPFGVFPPPAIVSFLSKSHKPAIYSTVDYQSISSENCGSFVARFIDELLKTRNLQDMDQGLTDHPSASNEKLVHSGGLVREPQ